MHTLWYIGYLVVMAIHTLVAIGNTTHATPVYSAGVIFQIENPALVDALVMIGGLVHVYPAVSLLTALLWLKTMAAYRTALTSALACNLYMVGVSFYYRQEALEAILGAEVSC